MPEGRDPIKAELISLARVLCRERYSRQNLIINRTLGEPAWGILLHLYVSAAEGKQVPVTSACAAALVPYSTAHRALDRLISKGFVAKTVRGGGKYAYVSLTPKADTQLFHLLKAVRSSRMRSIRSDNDFA